MCVEGTPEALVYSAKAVELDPKSARNHERHALQLYKAKRYAEAAAGATRALEITPVSVPAFTLRALSHREAGNRKKRLRILPRHTA
jgi:tetratricopeptide (TPR) repeat protein